MNTWVIFAGERGFWSRAGQFTTDIDKAKPFSYSDALAFCKRRVRDGATDAMPISLIVAREVLK